MLPRTTLSYQPEILNGRTERYDPAGWGDAVRSGKIDSQWTSPEHGEACESKSLASRIDQTQPQSQPSRGSERLDGQ